LPEINEEEVVDDLEKLVNEYFSSDEEQLINYFKDDFTSKVDKNK